MTRARSAAPASRASGLLDGWAASAMVAAVALAASVVGFGNDFAQDDLHIVAENVRIHSLGNVGEMFTTSYWPPPFSPDLYRPLTSVLLSLEYVFGAGAPIVYRAVSYLFYALAALAVFRLAAKLVPRRAALVAALLFAAHPVHVEPVALAVGQSEFVVALAAIGMTMLYLNARRRGVPTVREWLVIALLYAVACFTRETGFVLPGFLVAAEVLLVAESGTTSIMARVRRLWPGYALLSAVAVGGLAVRRAVLGGIGGTTIAEALQGLSYGKRLLTMLTIVPEWVRLFVWPLHLRSDYSPQEFPGSTHFGPTEALGAAILVLAVVVVVRCWRRAPVVSFGTLWSAIALLPVSNVLVTSGVILEERTLFLPSIGFALVVAGVVTPLWSWKDARAPRARRAVVAVGGVLVAAGIARSVERQRVWRNDAFLAVRTVQNAPKSFRAQRAYADLLFALGQRELALDAYAHAIAYAPPQIVWRVRNDFARQFRLLGEHAPEAEQLRLSLADRPDQDEDRGYLIVDFLALGQYQAASAEADTAVSRGGKPAVFRGLKSIADSAARAGAPAGSIKIGLTTGDVRSDRP